MNVSECKVFGVCVWTASAVPGGTGKWECVAIDGVQSEGRESFRRYVRQDMGRECVLMGMGDEDETMVVSGYYPRWDEVCGREQQVTPHMTHLNRAFLRAVCEAIDTDRIQLTDNIDR